MSNESKPGYKTTEFWLTLATNVAAVTAMSADWLPPKYGIVAMAVSNGLYAVLRTLAKEPAITTFVEGQK